MKYKRIGLLLGAACLLLFTGALVACRQDVITLEDLREQGYNCDVIFDLAGGLSGDGDRARSELHQYAKSGSLIVKPGDNNFSGKAPVKEGYTLGGYYRGTKKEDGTIEYDLSHKWDFKKDKVQEEQLTLYAYWRENYSIVIHYGADYGETHTVTAEQTEDGDVLEVRTPTIPEHTAIAYYATRAEAEVGDERVALSFPVTPSDRLNEESRTWEIWADAIEGNFTIVRTANDFRLSNGTNIYLLADIDFEEGGVKQEVDFPPGDYNGKFYGNGHTVSGFKVVRESPTRENDNLGLFKKLMETAVLQDVTFENFELEVITRNKNFDYNIGALVGYASEKAIIKNVTVKGTLCYTLADETKADEIQPFIGLDAGASVSEDCDWSGVVITKKQTS